MYTLRVSSLGVGVLTALMLRGLRALLPTEEAIDSVKNVLVFLFGDLSFSMECLVLRVECLRLDGGCTLEVARLLLLLSSLVAVDFSVSRLAWRLGCLLLSLESLTFNEDLTGCLRLVVDLGVLLSSGARGCF